MSEGDHLELLGAVEAALGGGQYSVVLDGSGIKIRACIGGRMKRNHINVMPGDRVTVSVSPYDTSHGFITLRH